MSNIPTCIIRDNFFKEPHKILEYANSLDFCVDEINYPGIRTEDLSVLNRPLFESIIEKVLWNIFDLQSFRTNYHALLSFQKINSDNIGGWVHLDIPQMFTFVIYLDEHPDKDSGTVLYDLKEEYKLVTTPTKVIDSYNRGDKFASKEVINSLETDRKTLLSHFDESIKISNKFNRMIMFDASVPHTQNILNGKDERLTLVGFVGQCDSMNQTVTYKSNIYTTI